MDIHSLSQQGLSIRKIAALRGISRNALRKHRIEQAERFLALDLGRPSPQTLIFEREGKAWNPATFSSTFYRAMHKAKLAIRFHDLRHAFATLSLRADVGLKTVSEMLGHETISITADIYSHVLTDMKADAAERLDATLQGVFAKAQENA